MKRKFSLALMVSLLPMLAVASANAQTYTRLISFGDSLTDNGNLFATTGNPPVPYNKRFTNRLTFAEYLTGSSTTSLTGGMSGFTTTSSANVNTANVNFAFGGARADNAFNSNGPIPSTGAQIAQYLGIGGHFGANDVVTLWAGANDLFQALPGAASNPATAASVMGAAATTAATTVGGQATLLSANGAKTMLVMNLPDFASAPQFAGGPAQALAGLSSSSYNSALSAVMSNVAASNSGTNFISVDINALLKTIIANPSSFGFANVTSQCVATLACVTGSEATRDTYLFWDGVHPTSAGHILVGKVAAQYLYTPTLTSGVAMLADETYANRHGAMLDMADITSSGTGGEGEKSYFLQVISTQGKRDMNVTSQASVSGAAANLTTTAYDYKQSGARIGMIQGLSANSSFAFSFSALTGDTVGYLVVAKPTTLAMDLGYNWHNDHMFVTATAGTSVDSYGDYERSTLLSQIKETQKTITATAISSSVEVGMKHDLNGMTLTPVGRLSYVRSDMRAFDEVGPLAMVNFKGRQVNALSGAVELQAKAKLSEGLTLNGVLGYEQVITGKAGALVGHLTGNTAKTYVVDQGDVANQGTLVGIGVTGHMGKGMNLSIAYRGTFGDHSQKNESAMISLSQSF